METMKGRVGKYEFWLTGKMQWEVRREGVVMAVKSNMSDCVRACEHLDKVEKTEGFSVISQFYMSRQASGLGSMNGMTR